MKHIRIVILFTAVTLITTNGIFSALAQTSGKTGGLTEETAEPTTDSNASPAEQREALERELAELERQILEQQRKIEEYRAQGKTLKREISSLNAQKQKLILQIKAIDVSLRQLTNDIMETQRNINETENRIREHKEALARGIQNLYEADTQTTVEILLANDKLSDFFGNLANIALVQENLTISLNEIVRLRQNLVNQKEELSLEKTDVENLKAAKTAQKKNIESIESEKDKLLKITKGKESEYQKLLQKTKASAAEIRGRIFELLGGGELTFEKAYEYARLAERATGVRAALILAILHQESLLGKNVGRCPYYDAVKGIYYMHPTRDVPIFLDLLKELRISPNSVAAQVSCPNRDGTYGGAMGPAQFIPSTWNLYRDDIARITGHNTPSPWNNADAFVATALYLKDSLSSSSCKNYAEKNKNIVPYQTLLERCAAAQYYAGRRWYTYRFVYGEPVIKKAREFQEDIDILNS